jgi:uncharacterized membrane protein
MKSISDISLRWLRRRPETLTEAESRVLRSAIEHQTISENTADAFANPPRVGDRLADAIARVGGSWTFIIGFLVFLAVWCTANLWLLGRDSFDPYPFIFLNLVLSMIAALQAPVIMMSQNRQAERDRIAAQHDYEVNLKAEIGIMALHDKMDMLREKEIEQLRQQVASLTEVVVNLAGRNAR